MKEKECSKKRELINSTPHTQFDTQSFSTTPPIWETSSTQGFRGVITMDCNVDNTILYNVSCLCEHIEVIHTCHPELVSGSYQRGVLTSNVNTSLLPMKWEKVSERQMRVKYVQEPSPIFYALSSSCKKSPLPQVGEGNKKVGVECL